jgi:hypothetical protein
MEESRRTGKVVPCGIACWAKALKENANRAPDKTKETLLIVDFRVMANLLRGFGRGLLNLVCWPGSSRLHIEVGVECTEAMNPPTIVFRMIFDVSRH